MIEFTKENQARFQKILSRYEVKRSALLPTLHLAQEQFGYVSEETALYIAKLLDLPPAYVFEALSFYTMFRKKDMGEYCLQVCVNITCTMMGAESLVKVAKEELGIGWNEVTEDKKFSLVPVQCLGSCDTAPVCQVNESYVEKLDPDKFRTWIKDLKSGEKKVGRTV